MKKIQYILLIVLAEAILFQGCRLNPSIMLKTGKDYKYSKFSTEPPPLYKISVNDELRFSIYSNDGFKLIDITTMAGENTIGGSGVGKSVITSYKVEFDGNVKFPLLGRIQLKGMTVREAERFLEEKYAAFYNKPFVLLEVTNRRVMIFPGSQGTAKVVPLAYENTTLLEALALAGGIASTGKAYKIKLIRGDLKNPEVYLIDLSTIEGMKQANLILQANDIIYVEPALRIDKEVAAEILPYLSLITTLIVFVEFLKAVKK